jgi:cytochrome c peroxidase
VSVPSDVPQIRSQQRPATLVLTWQTPPPPPGKSNVPWFLGALGVAALGGAYLFYGTDGSARDTAKELGSEARGIAAAAEGKLGLRHSQADYQKVYDAIAEEMERENYDGMCFIAEQS